MSTNAAIALIKTAAAIFGLALGLLALLGNYKSPTGALTPTGRTVFILIVLTAVAAVGASVIEAYKAESESTKQAARTERVLRELSRTIQPITQLSVFCQLQIPPGNGTVDRYIERLSSGIESQIDALRKVYPKELAGLQVRSLDLNREPLDIKISQTS